MSRYAAHLLRIAVAAIGAASCAAQEPVAILTQVRAHVAEQLARSANYSCVQVVDRDYFVEEHPSPKGCAEPVLKPKRKEMMRDRLRLDVAVSEGAEIYSWHGENKFSSSMIADVVRSGPIFSGGFIGFLQNIFMRSGIEFKYTGNAPVDDKPAEHFDYRVPLAATSYRVQTDHGHELVPYHGSFAVDRATNQLLSLEIIADAIPNDSNICTAEIEMHYQIANISGTRALLPALFLLRIATHASIYTVSRNQYSECHEFRGESSLHFDAADPPAESATNTPAVDIPFPAGITLHIGLVTPIDNQNSYTGDPIQAVLLDSVKLRNNGITIPKSAALHGIITTLELVREPERYYMLNLRFDHLTFGNNSFELRAAPIQSKIEERKLAEIYGLPLPKSISDELQEGGFVFRSGRFHLDSRFSADLVTTAVPPHGSGAAAAQ